MSAKTAPAGFQGLSGTPDAERVWMLVAHFARLAARPAARRRSCRKVPVSQPAGEPDAVSFVSRNDSVDVAKNKAGNWNVGGVTACK